MPIGGRELVLVWVLPLRSELGLVQERGLPWAVVPVLRLGPDYADGGCDVVWVGLLVPAGACQRLLVRLR